MYLYQQEPWKVTYYLEVLLVEPNRHCFIYLGFTAQVLKVCKTPGPTAY